MHQESKYHPMLFWLALATCVIAFVLIGSGGTVTSTGVGMVDEKWTFSPFNLFTVRGFEESVKSLGMFIEHSHRQLGYIVGMLAVVLACFCWAVERGHRRWIGVAVLVAVGLQGALGAARILLNPKEGILNPVLGRDYAMIHGFFGQVTFAFLVACTFTFSRSWISARRDATSSADEFQSLTKLLSILFLVQLTIAVLVRHYGGGLLLIAHASVAVLIFLLTFLVVVRSIRLPRQLIKFPLYALALEVIMMIVLGTAAWWLGAGYGALDGTTPDLHRMTLATLHQWLGALTLATSIILTMRTRRHLVPLSTEPPVEAKAER